MRRVLATIAVFCLFTVVGAAQQPSTPSPEPASRWRLSSAARLGWSLVAILARWSGHCDQGAAEIAPTARLGAIRDRRRIAFVDDHGALRCRREASEAVCIAC